jgi:tagaturonate reductase
MNPPSQIAVERPVLSHRLLRSAEFAPRGEVLVPEPALLALPERAVQFGTGAFLRGFVDFFLDQANRRGSFGGRVVMVGSTGSGRDGAVTEQDGLYTLATRGVSAGALVEERRVIASVSRALSARDAWPEVLACARDPLLEVVFSNTTEVGIQLDEGDGPELNPPRSFPGKLTRFLVERARAFGYDPSAGVVVVPCELIDDNGDRLRAVVLALAERWGLEAGFTRWLAEGVVFCNTLVDRIVPGTPGGGDGERLREELGYDDALLTVCEPYRLFAIQADDAVRARLRFADADPGIVVTGDVAPFRERKVRLLNGAHTISVPTALLCGCRTVREAVEEPAVGRFLKRVLLEELVPSVQAPQAERFAREVLDRFANPFIQHELFDITLHATAKMRVRVVPSLLRHVERTGRVPQGMALGFAGHLLFLRGELQEQRRAAGLPVPIDQAGERITELWRAPGKAEPAGIASLARVACADTSLWGTDLAAVPGFADAVASWLARASADGMPAALTRFLDHAEPTSEPALPCR